MSDAPPETFKAIDERIWLKVSLSSWVSFPDDYRFQARSSKGQQQHTDAEADTAKRLLKKAARDEMVTSKMFTADQINPAQK